MRLRPWQILTCSICFVSNLQSQEVRRALPVGADDRSSRLRERSRSILTNRWANRPSWTRTCPPRRAWRLGAPSIIPRTRRLLPAVPPSRTRKPEMKRTRTRSGWRRARDRMRRAPIRPKRSWQLPTGFTSASCTIWRCPNTRSISANSLLIPVDLPPCIGWQTVTRILARNSPRSTPIACWSTKSAPANLSAAQRSDLVLGSSTRKTSRERLRLYEKAYVNAKSPEVKLTARYYQAKCLELTGKKAEAAAAYADVAKFAGKNPYRDAARLSLAYFALENNQKQQAFDLFSQLGIDAAKPAVKAEALTRAGILAADLKQKDKADQLFKAAIALNAEGKWKQIAELEEMKLQYEGDKFSQVLDSYAKSTNSLGDETRPSVMLLVANSYRQLGKQQKALELYNQLIRIYSNTPEAYDARYQRLVSLDAIKDPSLVAEVDSYLATGPNRDRADKAKLLKAQTLFQQRRFEPAARLYLELTNSSLADPYKADCYYAAGFSFLQLNDSQSAIHAFTGLIDKFPKHRMASKALLKRALLFQEAKNLPAAVNDFNKIIADYPASAETETALLQKGLTLGQQADYQQMTAAFRELLKDYPNSTGAAQANYWIGWAAFEAQALRGRDRSTVQSAGT